MNFEKLQEQLGYHFGDQAILLRALTHTSYGHECLYHLPLALRDNERLEFLGDAVLDVVISDLLLEAYPNDNEGQLSKMRAAVVNEKTLAELGRSLQLHEVIRLGKGEANSGGMNKASILAGTIEALIAAIYLDGGFQAIYPVVRALFEPLFTADPSLNPYSDHKTLLQEKVQARWKTTPTYHLIETQGPDHNKTFFVEVRMNGDVIGVASGRSKKEAEQNAAKTALSQLEPSNNAQ